MEEGQNPFKRIIKRHDSRMFHVKHFRAEIRSLE